MFKSCPGVLPHAALAAKVLVVATLYLSIVDITETCLRNDRRFAAEGDRLSLDDRTRLETLIRDAAIYFPGTAGFEDRRTVHNGGCLNRHPAVIVVPRSKESVSDAIVAAQSFGLEISVRSGGHSYICESIKDGGLHIDLRSLNKVSLDESTMRAILGPGSQWDRVLKIILPSKYTMVHGGCASVG